MNSRRKRLVYECLAIAFSIALTACGSTTTQSNPPGPTGNDYILYVKIKNDTTHPAWTTRMWSYDFDAKWHVEGDPSCIAPGDTWETTVDYSNFSSSFTKPQYKTRAEMTDSTNCGGHTVPNGDTTEKPCTVRFLNAVGDSVNYRNAKARIVPVGTEYAVTDLEASDGDGPICR